MKTALKKTDVLTAVVFTLITLFTIVGWGHAQSIFGEQNVAVQATVYRGDPATGGVPLESVTINNSPVTQAFTNAAEHTAVLLEYEGDSYTFDTFPGG